MFRPMSMSRRGFSTRAEWLERGLFTPSPDEMVMLGLPAGGRVARLGRLRIADDNPLAIERASISAEFLPDPDANRLTCQAYPSAAYA